MSPRLIAAVLALTLGAFVAAVVVVVVVGAV